MSTLYRAFALACVFIMSLITDAAFAAGPDRVRAKVFSADPAALIERLERSGFDVAGIDRPQGFVEVIATPSELEALRSEGFEIRVIETWSEGAGRAVPPGYRHFTSIVQLLPDVETAYPEIARVVDLGAETGLGTTYEGRRLFALKISDHVTLDEDEPNVYIVGCHHAREVTTPEFCLWTIDKLTTLYGVDDDVTRWVNGNQIYICPVANPDRSEEHT
ncbi:MAG: hypothetical protein KJ645_13035, partial [Planctomycetes bacterium]|nr:hypothetical protein [Planctomycetota bacterium]